MIQVHHHNKYLLLQMNPEQTDYIYYDELSKTMTSVQSVASTAILQQDEDQYIDECNVECSNMEKKITVTLGKYDPKYKHLSVAPGLNLKGVCMKQGCGAYQSKTWVNLGFGTFDFSKARFGKQCQSCGTVVKAKTIRTFGFLKAKVAVRGIKQVGDQQVKYYKKHEQTEGKLIYFQDEKQDIQIWGFLQIVVSEL